jgi:hypothetical protein
VKCRVRATAAKYASCWICMGITIASGYEWLPHYDFALLRRTGIR